MSASQTFLDNAVSVLKKDTRFLGVAVAGSWITGTTDEFSDLDLIVVCEAGAHGGVMAERTKIAESLGDFLAGFTGEHVGEPRLLVCLYDNPVLHVDLKFIVLGDLAHRIENPVVAWERDGALTNQMAKSQPRHPMPDLQWIEDRFWIWVHYGATKLGRGELFEVIDFLSYLRGQILGSLSLVKHGQLPRGARRLETLAPHDLAEFEKTVPSHDFSSCVAATEATIALYRKLRDEMDDGTLRRSARAERVSLDYFNRVARRKGQLPR